MPCSLWQTPAQVEQPPDINRLPYALPFLPQVAYYLAHLFISLWLPNWAKWAAIKSPWVFYTLKQGIVLLLQTLDFFTNLNWGVLTGGKSVPSLDVVTGILKVGGIH